MNDPDDILIVMVVYSSGFATSRTFVSMSASVKQAGLTMDLVVYDNKPDPSRAPSGDYTGWNITYIIDEANGGVSKAYNSAARIAAERSKNWLLLLDEDTDFPAGTITTYLTTLTVFPAEQLFAPIMLTPAHQIISPCRFRLMRGFYATEAIPGLGSLEGKSLINCGLCVKLDAFVRAGGYNELIPLDFSDHDFIHRFKQRVTLNFVTIELSVLHSLSTAGRNTLEADANRFGYYLQGARHFSGSGRDTFFLKINALLRAAKLSVIHKTGYFITRCIKYIFD